MGNRSPANASSTVEVELNYQELSKVQKALFPLSDDDETIRKALKDEVQYIN